MGKRRKNKKDPSGDFIEKICTIYGDYYDDRDEDSAPGGADWQPGMKAMHRLCLWGYCDRVRPSSSVPGLHVPRADSLHCPRTHRYTSGAGPWHHL